VNALWKKRQRRRLAQHDPDVEVLGSRTGELTIAGEDLLGRVSPTTDGRFPLLVKLLDAHEHLSVQVHPHEAYVAAHPEARLKTESWYIVDADARAAPLAWAALSRIPDAAAVEAFVRARLGRRPADPGLLLLHGRALNRLGRVPDALAALLSSLGARVAA